MKKLLGLIDRLIIYLEKLLYGASITMVLIFIILIVYQVVSRNINVIPVIQWTEEVSRFSFMWMIILGATFAVLRSDHFKIDIFENVGNKKIFILYLRELLILIVLVVFIFGGLQFGISGNRRRSIAAGIPMWVMYISFFVMGIFGTLFTIYRLLILSISGIKGLEQLENTELSNNDLETLDGGHE